MTEEPIYVFMLIQYDYEDSHIYGIYSSRDEAINAKRELGVQGWTNVYDTEFKTHPHGYPYKELLDITPADAVTIKPFILNQTRERN